MQINWKKKTYQIGIPIHWGYRGIGKTKQDAKTPANMLSPAVIDPRVHTGV